MTRLDKALQTLAKAMGPRPFVVVYEQTHMDAERSVPKMIYRNGFIPAMGLVKYANWQIEQAMKAAPTTEEKP